MKLAFASVPCPHADKACAGMTQCLVRAAGNGAHCGAALSRVMPLHYEPRQPLEKSGLAA